MCPSLVLEAAATETLEALDVQETGFVQIDNHCFLGFSISCSQWGIMIIVLCGSAQHRHFEHQQHTPKTVIIWVWLRNTAMLWYRVEQANREVELPWTPLHISVHQLHAYTILPIQAQRILTTKGLEVSKLVVVVPWPGTGWFSYLGSNECLTV
jgi:hypothetical protein